MAHLEKVAFGGGCFWCIEAVFLELKGVIGVTPGYAGGKTENPTYEEVSSGKTGHAEVILIEYDSGNISFKTLLDVFFTSHDPTTVNRQGNDYGDQYRSTILHGNEDQKKEAEEGIKKLTDAKKFQNPIVTQIVPLKKFYPAEEYHKNYYAKHPEAGYSSVVIAPKVEKIRKEHPELLREK